MVINRFADNKIVERWTEIDSLGIMAQLGAIYEFDRVGLQEVTK